MISVNVCHDVQCTYVLSYINRLTLIVIMSWIFMLVWCQDDSCFMHHFSCLIYIIIKWQLFIKWHIISMTMAGIHIELCSHDIVSHYVVFANMRAMLAMSRKNLYLAYPIVMLIPGSNHSSLRWGNFWQDSD